MNDKVNVILVKFGKLSDIGLVRKINEDSINNSLTQNGHLFIVADGMGGMGNGDKASNLAIESVINYYSNASPIKTDEERMKLLHLLLVHANQKVYNLNREIGPNSKMGTTLVLLLIADEKAYIANVGDSRCYSIRFKGNYLNQISIDHSEAQRLVDYKIISKEAALHHSTSSILYRSIGTKQEVEPEVFKEFIQINTVDAFLLCTDGLYKFVSVNKILDTFENNFDDPQQICLNLVQNAKDCNSDDNISCIAVTIPKKSQSNNSKKLKNNDKLKKNQSNEDHFCELSVESLPKKSPIMNFFIKFFNSINKEDEKEDNATLFETFLLVLILFIICLLSILLYFFYN